MMNNVPPKPERELHLLCKQHLLVVPALTSHQFCHNYAPVNTTSRIASVAESTHPLKLQSYRDRRQ
jgi:hypothetical protein